MADAKRDNNLIPTLIAVSNADGITPVLLWADPVTHRLLVSATFSAHNLLSASHDDSVEASVVLGDIIIGNDTPKWARLAGNTTTTKKFLVQTGNGTISAAPSWGTIIASDIPDLSAVYAVVGHNHTGVYAPALGADDNYVTDAEKIAIGTIADKMPLSGGTMTGPIVQQSNINLSLPGTDHTATGNVTNAIQSGYTAAAFDLVFLGSGGKWLEVDADAVATCQGLLGIALEAKNDTQAMLVALPGSFVRDDTWNWTIGATLYAGETPGTIQEAIPTGADAIIKVIGFAVSADVIFFNPSPDQQSTVA